MAGRKGRSGRLPKPTSEHVLDGTYRSDRHAHRVDVLVLPERLECPESLTGEAQATWERIVTALPDDALCQLDVDALWIYCKSWATLQKIWAQFEEDPTNKDIRISTMSLLSEIDKIGRQFGWTPLSRASLRVPQRDDTGDDPLVQLLKRKAERDSA